MEKFLRKIPKKDVVAIRDAITELAEDPRGNGAIKLSGRDAYRVRMGNYRTYPQIILHRFLGSFESLLRLHLEGNMGPYDPRDEVAKETKIIPKTRPK